MSEVFLLPIPTAYCIDYGLKNLILLIGLILFCEIQTSGNLYGIANQIAYSYYS